MPVNQVCGIPVMGPHYGEHYGGTLVYSSPGLITLPLAKAMEIPRLFKNR